MLIHGDLDSWHAWQASRAPLLRRVRSRIASGGADRPLWITSWGRDGENEILLALDSLAPSQHAALLEPLRRLHARGRRVAIMHTRSAPELLPGTSAVAGPFAAAELSGLKAPPWRLVISAGDYLPVGHAAHSVATRHGLPFVVVQHGVMTPFAPPLPPDTQLMAWSSADLAFWADGRADISGSAVGAQLFWQANCDRERVQPTGIASQRVVFLGQLHGVELPRSATRRSVAALRKDAAVQYLPHPGETDFFSRLQHRWWRLRGLEVLGRKPIADIGGPVVGHFSTGILEAAALGIPSFAFCADPPSWLRELWARYGMSEWGASEATKVTLPEAEPAEAIADRVEEILT